MTRVLLLGGAGQLGRCLQDRWPRDWERYAPASDQLDIRDGAAVDRAVGRLRPDLVINAAAYNRVDEAERSPAEARAVNTVGAGNVARAAARARARLIHISTDYVFDGLRDGLPATRPYSEDDIPHPLNAYGESKRGGELAVLAEAPGAIVLRTAWLFSEYGHNFVRTVLRLAREGQPLRVVDDQVGSPTYAGDLAQAIVRLGAVCAGRGEATGGIYHYSGVEAMSWHRFADRIVRAARASRVALSGRRADQAARPYSSGPVAITSVSSAEYASPARRPCYSVLSCDKIHAFDIRQAPLAEGLTQVLRHETAPQGNTE
jgi:dTDP-4-dehydrorhamnose reductase